VVWHFSLVLHNRINTTEVAIVPMHAILPEDILFSKLNLMSLCLLNVLQNRRASEKSSQTEAKQHMTMVPCLLTRPLSRKLTSACLTYD